MTQDLTTGLLIGAFTSILAIIGAAILFYVRDIWLRRRDRAWQARREVVEAKLKHLYSPLYANLQIGSHLLGRKSFFNTAAENEKQPKEIIDNAILHYYYLSSSRLAPYLEKIYGSGFYNITQEDKEILCEILIEDYAALRDEYLEGK